MYNSSTQSGPKYCSQCGSLLRVSAKFCSSCGKVVGRPIPPAASMVQTTFTPTLPPGSNNPPQLLAQNNRSLQVQKLAHIDPNASLNNFPAATGTIDKQLVSWVWKFVYICLATGVTVIAIMFFPLIWEIVHDILNTIWNFVLEAFTVVLYVLFFPLLFSLGMIVIGFITNVVVPGSMAWAVNFGLWLLTQRWWWFPVGQIVGMLSLIIQI